MFTGKVRVCAHCGVTLREKVFSSGRHMFYTPWNQVHYTNTCKLKGKRPW